MRSTAKNLRFHTKEILETVSRGEEVIITHRGKPCAKLIPIKKSNADNDDKTSLFGIWQNYDKANNVDHYVRDMRKGRYL